jgi:peptidoglycan-associated lipoprotein
MKTARLLSVFFAGAALILGSAGCQHRPVATTQIPDREAATPKSPPPTADNTITSGGTGLPEKPPVIPGELIAENTNGPWAGVIANNNEDREKFKADTVYFDFDSATIKKNENQKLEEVANFFKNNTEDALRVEGNCDERGTEKYNLSLGERRALAVREYLANLGVDSRRVVTVTYGAAKPVDPGHNESAWKKNRRGELILLTPKR